MKRFIPVLFASFLAIFCVAMARADYIIIIADLAAQKKGSGSGSTPNGQVNVPSGGTSFPGANPGMTGYGAGGMGMGGMGMGMGGMPRGGMGARGGMGMGARGGMGMGGMGMGGMPMGGMGMGGMGMGGMGAGGMGMGGMGGRPGMGMPGMGMPGMGGPGGMPGMGMPGMGMPGMGTGGMGGRPGMPMDPSMMPEDMGGIPPIGMRPQGSGMRPGGIGSRPGSGSGSGGPTTPWMQGPNPFGGKGELPGSAGVYVPTPIRVVTIVEVASPGEKSTVTINKAKETVTKVTHELWRGEAGATVLYKGNNVDWMHLDEDRASPTMKQVYAEKRKALGTGSAKTAEAVLELAEWTLQHRMLKEFNDAMNDLGQIKSDHPAYTTYVKVRDALKAEVTDGDEVGRWRRFYDNYLVESKPAGHYVILHDLANKKDAPTPREVKSRKECLEETLQIFYYWFALKGISDINIPKEHLVAVLEADRGAFSLKSQMAGTPLVTDGFFSRELNLLCFSKDSLDPLRKTLADTTYDVAGKNKEALLKGPSLDTAQPDNQTLALLLRALERDSELSSTTHEGTRQLLTASGLLPRGLNAPEWVQSGLATFFEVPRGSPWPTCCSPSSLYLPSIENLVGDLSADPVIELQNVVTDRTFRQAEVTHDGGGHFKARAMAWALAYYLVERRPKELRNYFNELATLPRELELDETTLMRTFCRSFNLMKEKSQDDIDPKALTSFAKSWFNTMRGLKLESDEVVRAMLRYEHDSSFGSSKGSGSGSK
jgi:hypothetical protein